MVRSTPSTPRPPSELLRRLAQDAAHVHDDVTQHADSDKDSADAGEGTTDSDSPLLDSYFESGGSEAVMTSTNFTMTAFHLL
ncbi:hypothetical protein PI125_g18637 [Phytophthora idaei]|nr:hypothetical protein PI125_g18637 [Phytophthora idaei]